ncbi:MAG: ABC transporter substrate-binding protein [Deltaproteobacteria bacterium]|nr:ABC transporter substrate-binding protein [Deltaproteobacteria bacterium]
MKRFFLAVSFAAAVISASCAKKEVSTATTAPAQAERRSEGYKIGVILPLTGKYSVYGNSTLHGIECAVGIFSPCSGLINAELIIKDDAGDPLKSEAAVDELMNFDRVNLIIGPLSSSSVEAAANKAVTYGVPLISLSQKEGIAKIGDNIFSVALTAESQVNALVDWAVNKKKLKTFAIIYPTTVYGETYKELYREAVEKAQAKIVFSEGYGESTLDFGSIFRKEHKKFDACFIPDSYRAVGYISATMAAEGIKGVQLMGINRWNNPELIDRGGETLQGAVFVDGFFDGGSSPTVSNFVSVFNQAYGINPTVLESQSFDAAKLAAKAMQLSGGAHAADIKNSLAALPAVEGSTGDISFDSNREAIKRLFFLTVKEENIMELESANN